eukprot:scaffold76867_cov69-Phaeocystis_antarctica.AAC.1
MPRPPIRAVQKGLRHRPATGTLKRVITSKVKWEVDNQQPPATASLGVDSRSCLDIRIQKREVHF